MNVRLSPACGLITDRPSTRTAEVNYLQGPYIGSHLSHTLHGDISASPASIIRIVFLLLNTCGMRPRRSNIRSIKVHRPLQNSRISLCGMSPVILSPSIIINCWYADKVRCRMRTKSRSASFIPHCLLHSANPLSTHLASRRGPRTKH